MASRVEVTNNAGSEKTIILDGESPVSGGLPEARVVVGKEHARGTLIVRDFQGHDALRVESPAGTVVTVGGKGGPGTIQVVGSAGKASVTIDGTTGDVRLSGADCAELFDVADASAAEPGTVLVIAESGALRACDRPHDRRVAGVVSGAGGYRPGVLLNAELSEGVPVALMGRVFCKADATAGPIEAGSLLTTSSTPGHAMRADDDSATPGTVL